MSHLNEAISRYNKILEAPRHKDLSWVKLLHEDYPNHYHWNYAAPV